ncbi:MAG: hypothetical protein NVSMB19_05540 [Vulcanimicrobiaceae bacterium]
MAYARVDALQRLEECEILEHRLRREAAGARVGAGRHRETRAVMLTVTRRRIVGHGIAQCVELADDPPIRRVAQVTRAGRARQVRALGRGEHDAAHDRVGVARFVQGFGDPAPFDDRVGVGRRDHAARAADTGETLRGGIHHELTRGPDVRGRAR